MCIVVRLRRLLAAALLFSLALGAAGTADAQTGGATISGVVVDQQNGLPVVRANVELFTGTASVAKTQTDGSGHYAFTGVAPGSYAVQIAASGFALTRRSDVIVNDNTATIENDVALARASGSSLSTIGHVSTSTASGSLQSSTTITRSVDPQVLQNEGFNRLGDALGLLPGVNLRGQNANTGDDLYVDIRGLKPSETSTLLDGHPIGPIGVNSSQTAGGYDYMASPLVGLRNVQVTYGAGAVGLYGTDSAGGTVDWQTLNPSGKPTISASQAYGSLDHLATTVTASGTYGRLGFVLAHGVDTTMGLFNGSPQLQSGLLGTTLTSANYAKYTYPISGVTIIRSDLGKLQYNFGETTQLTLTAFANNAYEDKTGTGNNYTPYITQLFAATPAKSGACIGQIQVVTNTNPAQCMSPALYASLTSGPAGTGAQRFQTTGDQDYHARLTTQALHGTITLDGFENTYRYNDSTPVSQTTSQPTYATDVYQTFGFLASDDYQFDKDQFGFGWYVQHQGYNGIRNNYFNPSQPTATPTATIATSNFFIRNVFSFSRNVQLFANAWLKNSTSSETAATSLDPRLTLVVRPDSDDVVRFTGGKSVGLPDPTQSIGTGFTNAGSLNPQCTNLTPGTGGIGIGTPGVTGLKPETSVDFEAAYGHRFHSGTVVQGDYYNSSVNNLLFSTTVNASLYPGGTIPPAILSAIYNRVSNYSAACAALASSPAALIPYLAFTVPTNAATGLFRGLELSARHPITKDLTVEATWDVQSSVYDNIPTLLLQQNVFLINGSQVFGIPLQKQSAAFDYTSPEGFSAHLDATRIGVYNQFDAQPFIVANAFMSHRLGNFALTFGATNLFDARDSTYAQTGIGLYVPENQFGKDTTNLSQSATYNKLRGYQPQQFILTLSGAL